MISAAAQMLLVTAAMPRALFITFRMRHTSAIRCYSAGARMRAIDD